MCHASDGAQSASGCTALYLASETGDVGIVRLLLAHGADVALSASEGGTPLQRACHFGHEQCEREHCAQRRRRDTSHRRVSLLVGS